MSGTSAVVGDTSSISAGGDATSFDGGVVAEIKAAALAEAALEAGV